MSTAKDIIRQVEKWSGHRLNKDEGVQHGTDDIPLTGVTVSWMATPNAIIAAGKKKHQLLLIHESLYYPYDVMQSKNPPADWESWGVNTGRRELLEKYGLSCVRIHGSMDEICILDDFAILLGLGKPVFSDGLLKVYEIKPCSLGELTAKVKENLHMPALRVADGGNSKMIVRRVGLPWGGLGLFVNVGYQQKLVEQKCDVFIAGESDSYGFRFAVESGIPMIETSHEISENPGIQHFTQMMSEKFPAMEWQFHENINIWKMA
ncbi:MAG: Nif3-like dinuclear metal center hexameric protein [Victivallales bacterium]